MIRPDRRLVWTTLVLVLAACPPSAPTVAPHRGPPPTSCHGRPATDSILYDTTAIDEPPLPRIAPVVLPPPHPKRWSRGGRVRVAAIVDGDGVIEPASVGVIARLDPILDEEAQRVVKGTAFWPGCQAGRPVRVRIAFDVAFYEGGPPTHPSWAIFVYLGLLAGALFIPGFPE